MGVRREIVNFGLFSENNWVLDVNGGLVLRNICV
jgi:hypothetical protein